MNAEPAAYLPRKVHYSGFTFCHGVFVFLRVEYQIRSSQASELSGAAYSTNTRIVAAVIMAAIGKTM